MEYIETEIKILYVGEPLLICEPKIRFAVPVKGSHHPEYLAKRGNTSYALPESQKLNELETRLKQLRTPDNVTLE